MRKLIIILLMTISVSAYCQTEKVNDSIPLLDKTIRIANGDLENYLKLDDANDQKFSKLDLKLQFMQEEKLIPAEFYLPPIEIYSGPPLENNTLNLHFPFANDYSYHNAISINDNTWLSTSSTRSTYPTLGESRMVGAQLNYQPAKWLIISGGPYASKYTVGTPYFNDDFGANGAMKFIVNDRIRFNAFGQYSAKSKANAIGAPMMGMYPQTNYGGSIEVKITEKFGVQGGVIRELNPMTGKWQNIPFIAPVFYGK